MTRLLLLMVFCLFMVACNDSKEELLTNNKSSNGIDFDPTTTTLNVPPANGKLPEDLIPPA